MGGLNLEVFKVRLDLTHIATRGILWLPPKTDNVLKSSSACTSCSRSESCTTSGRTSTSASRCPTSGPSPNRPTRSPSSARRSRPSWSGCARRDCISGIEGLLLRRRLELGNKHSSSNSRTTSDSLWSLEGERGRRWVASCMIRWVFFGRWDTSGFTQGFTCRRFGGNSREFETNEGGSQFASSGLICYILLHTVQKISGPGNVQVWFDHTSRCCSILSHS